MSKKEKRNEVIKKVIQIADSLDEVGLTKEADTLNGIIESVSMGEPTENIDREDYMKFLNNAVAEIPENVMKNIKESIEEDDIEAIYNAYYGDPTTHYTEWKNK